MRIYAYYMSARFIPRLLVLESLLRDSTNSQRICLLPMIQGRKRRNGEMLKAIVVAATAVLLVLTFPLSVAAAPGPKASAEVIWCGSGTQIGACNTSPQSIAWKAHFKEMTDGTGKGSIKFKTDDVNLNCKVTHVSSNLDILGIGPCPSGPCPYSVSACGMVNHYGSPCTFEFWYMSYLGESGIMFTMTGPEGEQIYQIIGIHTLYMGPVEYELCS